MVEARLKKIKTGRWKWCVNMVILARGLRPVPIGVPERKCTKKLR
jgi:hypothetical protein